LPAVLVQSLDAIHEPQVEDVAAEDKEEIVLLAHADSTVDQSFPPEDPVDLSHDSIVNKCCRVGRDHISVVTTADDILELVVSASGDVASDVPHGKKQYAGFVPLRLTRRLGHTHVLLQRGRARIASKSR
jgi:hypothetical protein